MDDIDLGDSDFHSIDDIEKYEGVGGVIKGNTGTVEYLISFHQNITYATKFLTMRYRWNI